MDCPSCKQTTVKIIQFHLKKVSVIFFFNFSSEGEKVRVGDDLILVSVATERYLVSLN